MSPFLLVFIGMAVVVGGILALRLHAFLALILAALLVASLTPREAIVESNIKVEERGDADAIQKAEGRADSSFMSRVASSFGSGVGKIGILIAMAAIIGKCLLDSGAAEKIVVAMRSAFGEKRTPIAFSASAFTLGIPVFFDTVFYLLMPLGKAMRMKSGNNYLFYILSIVAGGTMAHSLVPPTPGPLFVASEMPGVGIGEMILGGLVVGIFTVSSGYFFAKWANNRWEIPLRPSAELSEEDLQAMANRKESDLPPLFFSLLPIILPLGLIAGKTAVDGFAESTPGWVATLGDKNVALILSALVALVLLAFSKRRSLGDLNEAVQSALMSGGVIILITAAGSAFGAILKETGIASALTGLVPAKQSILLIPIAYLITAAVRTAQGSATVAMVTAVGIVAPLAGGVALAFHPVYLALAIGCGSKPISWANDSGFWIIGRMSGMTPQETFKTASAMMIVMSLVGLAVVLIGAMVLPFAP